MSLVYSIILSINGNDANVRLPAGQVIVDKNDLTALVKANAAQARLLGQAAKQLTAAKFNPVAAAKVAEQINNI